jgi:tetratricopeptide (TPR) repeat protein
VGGIVLAGTTLHQFQTYDSPQGYPDRFQQSPSAASSSVETLKSHVESHPDDFNAWARLGIAHFYAGPDHYAEGLNAIDRARSLGSTSESLFYFAGMMYEALGLPDYAANELSKYLRHFPQDFETQVRLANLLAKRGKLDDALKQYEVLSQRADQDPVIWFNMGVVLKEKGELDRASSCFLKVHSLSPEPLEGLFYQEGEIAKSRSAWDDALPLYLKELERYPQSLPALLGLESVQKKKNLWKEARDTRSKITVLKSTPTVSAQ